jgi:teichuronic acid biosynthesis glycosyltransferase TuaC
VSAVSDQKGPYVGDAQTGETWITGKHVLRVLMVTADYPTVSRPHSGTFIKSQIDSLAQVGVDATVLHVKGRAGWKYLQAAWQVLRMANSEVFDLVHGHYGLCGIVARAQWRLPVVVSFCGSDLLGAPNEREMRPFLRRVEILSNVVLAHLVDGVIVKSPGMRRVLGPRPRVPIAVIPNGVDLGIFRSTIPGESRKRLRFDDAMLYAIFPAAPANLKKGFRIAQGAVEQLRSSGVAMELVPVFGRPHRDMVDFYNAADVVLLPSLSEGSPNVVKEAMACGAPLAVADVGDVREILGQTPGCVIAERTPDAFAQAILSLLPFRQARTPGRERVAHLSLDAVAARVRAVYEAALARHVGRHARRRGVSTT